MGNTKKAKRKYNLLIKVNGMEYEGAGNTIEDALLDIEPPKKIGTKTIIRVTHDGKSVERMVRGALILKLFHPNPFTREVVIKSFKMQFGL